MITGTTIIIETGNWKAKLVMNEFDEKSNYNYIEASTIALEEIYGVQDDTFSENFELIELYNETGENTLDDEECTDEDDIPDPVFGVLTICYREEDEEDEDKWRYFLTSDLFANAAQPHNVKWAKKIEKKWAKEIKEFKNKERELKVKSKPKKTKKTKKK